MELIRPRAPILTRIWLALASSFLVEPSAPLIAVPPDNLLAATVDLAANEHAFSFGIVAHELAFVDVSILVLNDPDANHHVVLVEALHLATVGVPLNKVTMVQIKVEVALKGESDPVGKTSADATESVRNIAHSLVILESFHLALVLVAESPVGDHWVGINDLCSLLDGHHSEIRQVPQVLLHLLNHKSRQQVP